MIQRLVRLMEVERITVLSTDLFDTFLLRNTKPELLRFAEIAQRQAVALRRERGAHRDWRSLYEARVLVARIAYQTASLRGSDREARLAEIIRLMLVSLRLPPEFAPLMLETELAYESENLRVNRPLLQFFRQWRAQHGGRVFYLSDMYLSGGDIEELIARASGDWRFDGGEVSSDHSVAKRSGGLFRALIERHGLAGERILHLGDNFDSDVRGAHKAGIRALYTPRPLAFRLTKYIRECFYHE